MSKVLHIIGNGDNASLYDHNSKGVKITCNIPPFPVPKAYATCIVDFKMCAAIREGSVNPPGDWVMGFRPKKFTEMHPDFYLKISNRVRQFYLTLPKYARNYTDFNCGHFAAHYSATTFKPDEIHVYGIDSLFDMNLNSCSDFFLNSDRTVTNNVRLNDNWRPIWHGIFQEFGNIQWVLHHKHDKLKIPKPPNVEVYVKK